MSEALRLAAILEDEKMHSMAIDTAAAAELRRLHELNAELVEALQRFSNMYGHLWDSADTKGAGWLSPDSVKAYDDLHELVGELLRKVEASNGS